MKRFVASLAGVCSFALVATGLAVPTAMADEPAPAAVEEVSSRPDGMSAVLTAKALGKRIEDLSQRTEREQVFANPDGTWTSESTALTRFSEKDGQLVPIEALGTLESAGETMTGSGTVLSVADGTEALGSGPAKDSVALATLEGTGELKGKKLELGWEGKLPAPEVEDNVATYDQGVSVPIEERGAGEPAKGQTPPAETSAEASVTVEPTLTGFSHRTVLDQAPEGDVVLRFPLKLSKGLKAERDETSGDLRVMDEKGKLAFFAPAPSMWDAKVEEASGLHPAETKVETTLESVDGVQTLVLHVDQAWLKSPERQYPVTIDPTWTAGVSDTWVQTDETGSKAGDPELRVGTYDSGAHKARSFLNNGSQALAGKKILKAELKMHNWHSWSCTSAPVKIQRLTAAWSSTDVRWTAQPPATTSGEGSLNVSKGYSASCDDGYVYYPMTPIAQYWADNPKQIFGVRLIATDETNNFSWKRYRSANYATTPAQAPTYVITYASYPGAPSAVSFNSGESSKDGSGKMWVKTKTPTFKATVADPDGGKARAGFDLSGGATWDKKVGNDVSPSGVSSYKGTLEEGKTYTTKAWTSNYQLWSKSAGPAATFTVDTIQPISPGIIASGGITYDSWMPTAPASNVFTFISSADTDRFEYSKNGGAWTKLTATDGKATLAWNPTGANTLLVRAVDKAGNVSFVKTLNWGNGSASLVTPLAGTTTSDAFKVQAGGPTSSTGAVTPKVYWREADSVSADTTQFGATAGWYEAATLPAIASGQPVKIDTMLDVSASPANKLKELGKERIPALVEVQVCFDYEGAPAASKLQCTTNKAKKAVQVTKLPHAFGSNYPTAEAGDGQVALTTGELNVSETDVSVDAGNTGLSVSRTYSSYSGIGANSRIFGKGWRANIEGPEEGLSGLLVAESTALDGTITLISDDETAAVFRQPGNGKVSMKAGLYTAANEEATAAGWKLELTGTGTAARIKVTEEDGTVTSFKKGAILEGNPKINEWTPDTVSGGASVGTSRFVSDSNGRTIKVIAGTENNANCDPSPVKGCRLISLEYDAAGKISKVSYMAWDPQKNAMATVPIAEYGYDNADVNGRLTSIKDSRTGDVTTYTYGADSAAGVPLLASTEEKTSGGARVDAPTYYEYGMGNNASGRSDWLQAIKRGNATDGGGKVQAARFVYGVSPVADGATLPNLAEEKVKLWDQGGAARPITGYAVFGTGKDINTSKASGVAAGDWKYGDLQYVDGQNRVVNTASYAAGAWQATATVFNTDGNVERSYDARAIRNMQAQAAGDPSLVDAGMMKNHQDYAAVNIYWDDLDAYVDADGNGTSSETDAVKRAAQIAQNEATAAFLRGYVTHSYSPVTTDENDQPARVHTSTSYTDKSDIGAGGMPRMLVTKTVTTKAEAGDVDTSRSGEKVLTEVTNGYNALEVDSAGKALTDKTNKRSGWVNGAPTEVTQVMGAGQENIVVQSRFDEMGRVKESRQPKASSTGAVNDAGATTAVYYTAGANADDAACGNKPEFAGYLCKSTPKGPGSVKKFQSEFNLYGQPAKFTESSTGTEGATRTTIQTYREDGQELRTTVTATGLSGSTPVQGVEKLYDATGVQNGTRAIAGNGLAQSEVAWKQDLWGRTTSYTNSLGETSTTEYDAFGNVTKSTTPKGTNQYWYGALSGDGTKEYGGKVTKMTVSNHGGTGQSGTYTASYDGDGNLLTQGMPGGFSQINDYENTSGKPVGTAYAGPVKAEDGTTATATWIKWSTIRDETGRIVGENTPDGELIGGTRTGGDHAAAYDKAYQYDRAGRLTQVTDTTAQPGEQINTDAAEGDLTPVTVRKYTFDKNGNRTSLTTTLNGTQTAKRTWSYDAADRVGVGSGYVYDGLGRQTTIPALDAPQTATAATGTGAITLGYYDNDSARTITRNGQTTTIGLDPAGRRLNLVGSGTDTSTEVKHYTDDSDNPSWSVRKQGTNERTTRYESTIGGDLALTITENNVELAISNPHGDTVATLALTGDKAGTGISSWAQYDEYGNQLTNPVSTGTTTYGWHGADQRALDTSGLILMGARLYNSTTGLFTTRDPVEGGNDTTYAYPSDPVNKQDISGLFWAWVWRLVFTGGKWVWRKVATYKPAPPPTPRIVTPYVRQTSFPHQNYRLTVHAKEAMKGRGVTRSQVTKALKKPTYVLFQNNGLRQYVFQLRWDVARPSNNKWLVVVYNPKNRHVVTVMVKTRREIVLPKKYR